MRGESDNSYRCEGEGICEPFTAMEGTFEEKSKICLDCQKCHGKAPLKNNETSPEQIEQRVIAQTQSIVRKQNAGTLDLNDLTYEEWLFLEIWRDEEHIQDRIHKQKLSAMFEMFLSQFKG